MLRLSFAESLPRKDDAASPFVQAGLIELSWWLGTQPKWCQGSAEISSKMCSIRNQSRMGTEGTSCNLRSAGHFRVGSVPSAGNRPFQKSAKSLWKVGSFVARKFHKKFAFGRKFHKKFAYGSTFVCSENVFSRQLHVALKIC